MAIKYEKVGNNILISYILKGIIEYIDGEWCFVSSEDTHHISNMTCYINVPKNYLDSLDKVKMIKQSLSLDDMNFVFKDDLNKFMNNIVLSIEYSSGGSRNIFINKEKTFYIEYNYSVKDYFTLPEGLRWWKRKIKIKRIKKNVIMVK